MIDIDYIQAIAKRPPIRGSFTEGIKIPDTLQNFVREIEDSFGTLKSDLNTVAFKKTEKGYITNHILNSRTTVKAYEEMKFNSQKELVAAKQIHSTKDFKNLVGDLIDQENKYRYHLESYTEATADGYQQQLEIIDKGKKPTASHILLGNDSLYCENSGMLEKTNPELCQFLLKNIEQNGISEYPITHGGEKYTATALTERAGFFNLWGKRHLVGIEIEKNV